MAAYSHPLGFLLGLEGVALLRAGSRDRDFVQDRLGEVARLVAAGLDGEFGDGEAVGAVDVLGGYRIWSGYYDDQDNPLIAVEQPVVQPILAALPIGRALDAACGTGRHSGYLVGLGHQVVGVDASPEMLARARVAVPGAQFRQGDLTALPVGDGEVDLVVCALALAHVRDLRGVLGEFTRVLSAGGHLVVSDIHASSRDLGGVPSVILPDGRSAALPSYPHLASDYLTAAIDCGLRVRHLAEPLWPADPGAGGPLAQQWCPTAAATVYQTTPAAMIWHFQRD